MADNRINVSDSARLDFYQSSQVLNIGLVQINNSFSGQNYLPYSLACLRSYVEEHSIDLAKFNFLPMIYKRMPIGQIVDRLKSADIVGFSTYVWNARISLEVAKRLKKINPNVLIVFGGPQVPDKPESFLKEHRQIDVAVHNEGEKTFLKLLESFPRKNWGDIPGISFLDTDQSFIKTPPADRMRDLSEVPSPFLNGMFNDLMAQNPDEKWIGLWETNRGCPFKCTFCDWGSATAAKVNSFEMDRLEKELRWFVDNKIEYIFVCDANFGSQKRDIEISSRVAKLRSETGYPQGFSVQSTKNATERAYITQKILADAGLNKGVALSMQSLDAKTLEHIKRDNISLDTYLELSNRFTKDKVETYSDLILGLPGETYDSYLNGIDTLINSGQHNRIQFNNLSILPNAEMGDPDYLAKYEMVTVQSEIINIHGSKVEVEDDVPELQEVVISTYSMGEKDWRRARAISWMIAFLYFNKLVQMPLLLVHELAKVSYKNLFEMFMTTDDDRFPILSGIRDFFHEEALAIQSGRVEYKYSDEWLGVYWPADEYAYIQLAERRQMNEFYSEVEEVLRSLLPDSLDAMSMQAINDALRVNSLLISQPYLQEDIGIEVKTNALEFWQAKRAGEEIQLKYQTIFHRILRSQRYYSDLQAWCREIVWWGNKKGAYLYSVEDEPQPMADISIELAGHY